MKDVLRYKNFIGTVHFSPEDNVLFGKIEGINDLVTFEADNVNDLISEFESAVDDYLDICSQKGITPTRSAKGSFNVRTSPEEHSIALKMAFLRGYKSLNHYVAEAIKEKNQKELVELQ